MRESGAEGCEGCGKLRGKRHSHIISERERERRAENEAARAISRSLDQSEHQNNQHVSTNSEANKSHNVTVHCVHS